MSKTTFGEVQLTDRGFEFVEFIDLCAMPCSLQVSSISFGDPPGTTAIWLGTEKVIRHPVTGEELSPRMHLMRDEVIQLIAHLQAWIDTGSIILPKGE